MSFAIRLKRKRGRTLTVVTLGEKSIEGRFDMKASVFGRTSALRMKICVKNFLSRRVVTDQKSHKKLLVQASEIQITQNWPGPLI